VLGRVDSYLRLLLDLPRRALEATEALQRTISMHTTGDLQFCFSCYLINLELGRKLDYSLLSTKFVVVWKGIGSVPYRNGNDGLSRSNSPISSFILVPEP
jgi:hypothetical protein